MSTCLARIYEFASLQYTIRSNAPGTLTLTIHEDAGGVDQLVNGNWIEVYREGATPWSGVICRVERALDEDGDLHFHYGSEGLSERAKAQLQTLVGRGYEDDVGRLGQDMCMNCFRELIGLIASWRDEASSDFAL